MKKIMILMLSAVILSAGLCACGSSSVIDEAESSSDTLNVVTTIFPVYDWTKNIAGADDTSADIYMLINKGVDLHSYQPSAEDILRISECDIFIYVGGESDAWVEDALSEAVNEDMVVVDLMDSLGNRAKEEELVEGMQESEEEGVEEEEGPEYDEHIWLSLKNASFLSDTIADALSEADPANSESYKANASAYKEEIDALDAEFEAAVSEAQIKTLLFGDRFPFRYMTEDYGLDYYAAFIGCSAETEASFETIAFLSGKVDELGLKSIMTIEGQDHSIAESIRDNTAGKDQNILTMDSMQSMTADDVEDGADYLSVMESNLEVLREALAEKTVSGGAE